MAGRCDFFRGVRVLCGTCGMRGEFYGLAGGDGEARKAGWQIEWRPQPYVRCPTCKAEA